MTQDTVDKVNGFGKMILIGIAIIGMVATFAVGFNQVRINADAVEVNKTEIKTNTQFRLESSVIQKQIEKDLSEVKADVKKLLSR